MKTGREVHIKTAARLRSEVVEQKKVSSLSKSLSKAAKIVEPKPVTASHVIVEAGPGCGKTSTLCEGLNEMLGLPRLKITDPSPQQSAIWDAIAESKGCDSIGFVAFSKTLQKELAEEVPESVVTSTVHSMGFKACLKAFPCRPFIEEKPNQQNSKNHMLIERYTKRSIEQLFKQGYGIQVKAVCSLVSLCKVSLFAGTNAELDELAFYHDIELNGSRDKIYAMVRGVLDMSKDLELCEYRMDFDDQIWLPNVNGYSVDQFDLLLYDECVPSYTPVMMSDGGSKQIIDIQVGDTVRCYDVKKGTEENKKVTATQKIPNRKPLVKIKVRHDHRTGTNRKTNFVNCTTDHKIWTSNRGWVKAGSLKVGDKVIVETAAETTIKGKISGKGKDHLSKCLQGNSRGTGANQYKKLTEENRGGNGRGVTNPQQNMLDLLGDGWEPELSVSTGVHPRWHDTELSSHYKIDIANKDYLIAIEIDGGSHNSPKRREQDAKKEKFLRSKGWTVYRFTNREVRRDIHGCIDSICIGDNCPKPATVESVEPTYINEDFVYDITVEDCHNFYANGILVHNCQDANSAQQNLILKAGKRLVLVGDKNQAIFSFAGAMSDSIKTFESRLQDTPNGVKTLPLNTTYRCGKAIVAEAQKIVPELQAYEGNPEGKVIDLPIIGEKSYVNQIKAGDMVICRNNAPLVSECFRLLAKGVFARIRGKSIGRGLMTLVDKAQKSGVNDLPELIEYVETWGEKEDAKESAKKKPSDRRLQTIKDKVACVLNLVNNSDSISDLRERLNSLFSDYHNKDAVMLSSIHRSKGLEADAVYILCPQEAPLIHPKTKSYQMRDAECLKFVAITRAKSLLAYVS